MGCPTCAYERTRRWRLAHPEQMRAINRADRLRNLERCRASVRRWQQKNRQAARAASRAYYKRMAEACRERARARYAADPLKAINRQQAYYATKREEICAKRRKRYKKNRARENECSREWRKANPQGVLLARHVRRARLKANHSTGVTPKQWAAICNKFRDAYGRVRCAYCRKACKPTIDHVIPISRGGKHDTKNVVPACLRCNRSKHNRLLSEWRPRRP